MNQIYVCIDNCFYYLFIELYYIFSTMYYYIIIHIYFSFIYIYILILYVCLTRYGFRTVFCLFTFSVFFLT